ncbi:unknown protein [Simkania negevensis Z]|uniref:Uncharacterized protein n=1 Tax=Simkania negevensis (strain ATCC VR-1471 / DSM 27360 / Z) TaxID=331113 RepID=F8L371_SIMNZ|nr:unknown protein [Simkania negevensis Z]
MRESYGCKIFLVSITKSGIKEKSDDFLEFLAKKILYAFNDSSFFKK